MSIGLVGLAAVGIDPGVAVVVTSSKDSTAVAMVARKVPLVFMARFWRSKGAELGHRRLFAPHTGSQVIAVTEYMLGDPGLSLQPQ